MKFCAIGELNCDDMLVVDGESTLHAVIVFMYDG